ncbi:MAG: choice-of-anchor tandem repeat GloVer-containing protein [Candidatus Korobacteraceae bacterium]
MQARPSSLPPLKADGPKSCLFSFRNGNDGSYPYAGLIFDPSKTHLYGANSNGGTGGGGTIFELTPGANCSWTLETLYSFTGGHQCGPWSILMMDSSGNLLGTTKCDGANGFGNVFKLTNTGSGWTYTSLHDFTGQSDGGYPISNVSIDGSGNLYGTASTGGSQGVGVVWEITP